MNFKILLENEDIRLEKYDSGVYILNTIDSIGRDNDKVALSKEDIERVYFSMKLNEVK